MNKLKNDYLILKNELKNKEENKIITFKNNNHKTYFNDPRYIGSYLSKDFYEGSIVHLFQNKYIVENEENKKIKDEIFNDKKKNYGYIIKYAKMKKIYITEILKPPVNFLTFFSNVKHLILYEMSNNYMFEKQWLLHNQINTTSGFGFGFNLNFDLLKTCKVMNDLYSRGFVPPPGQAGLIMKIGWPKVKDMLRKKGIDPDKYIQEGGLKLPDPINPAWLLQKVGLELPNTFLDCLIVHSPVGQPAGVNVFIIKEMVNKFENVINKMKNIFGI